MRARLTLPLLAVLLAPAPGSAGADFPTLPRRIEIGRIALESPAMRLVTGRVALAQEHGAWRLAVARLRPLDAAGRPLTAPLALSGRLGGDGGRAEIEAEGNTLLRLELLRTDAGFQLFFDTGRLRFGEGGLDPGRLVPALGRAGIALRGEAELYGQIARLDERRAEAAELVLSGVDLAAGSLTVSGLSATLDFDRLLPPSTLPAQRIAVARLDAGIPLDHVELRLALDPGPVLRITDGRAHLAGGLLRLRSAALSGWPPSGTLELALSDVDFAQLVVLLGAFDAQAQGRVAGTGRLEIDRGIPVRLEAWLSGNGPGVLRWQGPLPEQEDLNLRTALSVLRDFRYEVLEATLAGDPAGELELAVRLRGTSPEAYGERPIDLHMRFSGPLGRVLAGGALAAGLARDLRRALEGALRAAPSPPPRGLPADGAVGAAERAHHRQSQREDPARGAGAARARSGTGAEAAR